MAKSSAAIQHKNDQMADLLSDGQITLGDVSVRLKKRDGTRLVISFCAASDGAIWLSETCEAENFSQLSVNAKSPQAFHAPALQAFLEIFASHPLCKDNKISLCGAGPACAALFASGRHFQNPNLVAFDPPSDLNKALGANSKHCAAAYVFYDPLVTAKPALMKNFVGPHIHWLKVFAAQSESVEAFQRMKLLQAILPAALRDELDISYYYSLIRVRKNFYFYRMGIEAALIARSKPKRVAPFRNAFRNRRRQAFPGVEFATLRARAEENRPDRPGSWLRTGQAKDAPQSWPSAGGNVWMLETGGDSLRYLSDRWHGVTMGFEERRGVTLAQTPPVALGVLSFGDGLQVERPLKRRFPWHVVDAQLDGTTPAFGPASEATLLNERRHATHEGLYTILAIGQSQAGITAPEALPGAPAYVAALDQIKTGRNALKEWGKALFVDRVRLALLTGAPETSESDAADHYAQVATGFAQDICKITDQNGAPFITVVPQAGTRHDGTAEVSLAEGRFDLDNPTLNALVPTPAYPWPLMAGTPGTHSPEAALLMDELCMLAVCERQAGRPWHCPALQLATVTDRVVTAQFSSLDGLAIDDGPHGFHLIGKTPAPTINKVEIISNARVQLHLDTAVTAEGLQLAYAWGHRRDNPASDHSANHGTLRDRWSQPSASVPEQTLYRYALPGKVPLLIDQKSEKT